MLRMPQACAPSLQFMKPIINNNDICVITNSTAESQAKNDTPVMLRRITLAIRLIRLAMKIDLLATPDSCSQSALVVEPGIQIHSVSTEMRVGISERIAPPMNSGVTRFIDRCCVMAPDTARTIVMDNGISHRSGDPTSSRYRPAARSAEQMIAQIEM